MQCLSPKSIGFNEFSSNIATALVCLATHRVYKFSKMIFDGMVKNVNNKVSKFLMYLRFLSKCLKMGQFGQITHTHTYVVPFHTRKIFTTLRVNSPSFSERTVPLFPSMLVTIGEGLDTPTEPHHTPSPEAQQTSPTTHSSPSFPPITTEPLPTVTPSDTTQLRQYTRRARIAYDSTPRVTSLTADEGCMQHQIQELTALCTSLQRQHTEMASKIEAQELEITNLKARVKLLKDREGGGIAHSGDNAPIKGRSLDEGEEAAEKGSNDTEEMVNVLTSLDAATVLSSGVTEVPTGSGSIPTTGPPATGVPTGSEVVPTASPIFTTATESTLYTRKKGKEKMVESDTPKKKKLQEQIDVQVMMIDGLDRNNETVAKYLQEYHQFAAELPLGRRIELINDLVKYQDNYAKVLKFQTQQRKPLSRKQQRDFYTSVLRSHTGWKANHFKGMTLEEIKEKFDPVWKQMQDFIPIGSKEESERFKRKGLRLEQDSSKKLKTSKEVPEEKLKEMMELIPVEELWALVKETLNIRPATNDKGKELWVELKGLYEPDVEDQLWTPTQNMMHALIEWKLYDTCRVHQVISKDQEIFMLVEKDYPLRKGLAIVMICYKLQVENYSQMANDLIMKIYKIANSPRQQYN
nr:hypothetical protein [Tanacetum cinerariifolium]